MSKVFNMVGGGGGKNISSIIITGLESTDTITCTKDGKSYTATWDSTAQHWEIVGLPLGTFTVTATNGTKTTTETVLIDIAGVYEIEMEYKLWLYNDGNPFDSLTGGWSYYAPDSSSVDAVTLTDTAILLQPTSTGKSTGVTMNDYVDATGYTTAYLDCERTAVLDSGNNNRYFDVVDSNGKSLEKIPSGDGVTSLDISSLGSLIKVKIWLYNMQMKITKVWLE